MNPKALFRRYLPAPDRFHEHRHLRHLGSALHKPDLWHLNRRSAAGAVAVGLFVGFLPIPFQMLLAALIAILLRVNLPISVVLVWFSNPITIPPLLVFAYEFGAWLLGIPPGQLHIEMSWAWFGSTFLQVWEPLWLGCLILGSLSALTGYISIRILWRLHLIRIWKKRNLARQQRRTKPS